MIHPILAYDIAKMKNRDAIEEANNYRLVRQMRDAESVRSAERRKVVRWVRRNQPAHAADTNLA